MRAKDLYENWLAAVSLGVVLAGIVVAFLLPPDMLPLTQPLLAKWIFGVLGATMMGWGTTVFLIARYAFRYRVPGLLNGILAGLVVWFVPDCLISAYFGAFFNVIVNIIFLVLLSVPLLAGQGILKRSG